MAAAGNMASDFLTKLPNEILDQILLRMSTTDLLHVCRLVSQKWYTLSTSLCRKRSIFVKYDKYCQNPSGILEAFGNNPSIPCSSITIKLSYDNFVSEVNCALVTAFGSILTNLVLYGVYLNYSNLVYILKNLSHLEWISIYIDPYSENLRPRQPREEQPTAGDLAFKFPPVGQVKLPLLKKFNVYSPDVKLDKIDIDFVEFVFGASDKITFMELSLTKLSARSVERIVQLLSRVDSIVLDLRPDYQGDFDFEPHCTPFKAKELNITMYEVSFLPTYSDFLENFIFCCQELRCLTFQFKGRHNLNNEGLKLRIPSMLELQELKIICSSPIQVNPITAAQFPKLKKLAIHCRYPDISLREMFDTTLGTFDNVEDFEHNQYKHEHQWFEIFPKIYKFTATIRQVQELEHVFNIKNLQMLHLTMTDMNCNRAMRTCFFNNPIIEVRELMLSAEGVTEHQLVEGSALLLNRLSPLILEIRGTNYLSAECISKLRSHHRCVRSSLNKKMLAESMDQRLYRLAYFGRERQYRFDN